MAGPPRPPNRNHHHAAATALSPLVPAVPTRTSSMGRASSPTFASRTSISTRSETQHELRDYRIGRIGQALAHAFARKNIGVTIASRRPPEALTPPGSGNWTHGRRQVDAGCARGRHDYLGSPVRGAWRGCEALPSWEGKTVIDATNTNVPIEELEGMLSSSFVAKAFAGAKFVKGFNHLIAATLATDPVVEGGHRVVFLSSDDEDATAPRGRLGQTARVRTRQIGKTRRGWRAGARTRPHLGPADLPGSVQEGAVADRPSAVRSAAFPVHEKRRGRVRVVAVASSPVGPLQLPTASPKKKYAQ